MAVSRCRFTNASWRLASAISASRSKRAERASSLLPRVSSCITPTERMVMKSRVRLNRSGPSTGRLLMPAFRVGSGRRPAAAASWRDACAAASCAGNWRERSCASRSASSSVSATAAWVGTRAAAKRKASHAPRNVARWNSKTHRDERETMESPDERREVEGPLAYASAP